MANGFDDGLEAGDAIGLAAHLHPNTNTGTSTGTIHAKHARAYSTSSSAGRGMPGMARLGGTRPGGLGRAGARGFSSMHSRSHSSGPGSDSGPSWYLVSFVDVFGAQVCGALLLVCAP